MSLSNQEFNDLIVYAFRYSLGRMTYAVHDVAQLIIHNKHKLFKGTIALITKEIRSAIELQHAGMDMDVQEWRKVLKELENINEY